MEPSLYGMDHTTYTVAAKYILVIYQHLLCTNARNEISQSSVHDSES